MNQTISSIDSADIVVTGAKNEFGEDLETGFPAISKVTSSDISVVTVSDNTIIPRSEGFVTLTVEFTDEDVAPVTLDIEVKAAQKVTSIDATDAKIKAETATDVEFTVLDQNAKALRTGIAADAPKTVSYKVLDADNEEVVRATNVAVGNDGKSTISFNQAEGTYKVEVSYDGNVIGSFTVETVDVTSLENADYSLTATKEVLDVNRSEATPASTTLTIGASVKV